MSDTQTVTAAKRTRTRTIKVYVVSHPDHMDRLVRADSAAEAIRHASHGYEANLATQDDIISLMAADVAVETAGFQDNTPEPAGLSD